MRGQALDAQDPEIAIQIVAAERKNRNANLQLAIAPGDGKGCTFAHAGVGAQHRLDFSEIHPMAANFHDLIKAADPMQQAVIAQATQIAGAKGIRPAVQALGGGQRWIFPIPQRDD